MTVFFDLYISDKELVIKSLLFFMNFMFPNLSCWLFFRCFASNQQSLKLLTLFLCGHLAVHFMW